MMTLSKEEDSVWQLNSYQANFNQQMVLNNYIEIFI